MKTVFILGAPDPEMQLIKEAVVLADFQYANATYQGMPVKSYQAYDANATDRPVTGFMVFVECEVRGISPAHIIDHHRKGDMGYGLCPEHFWQASSIGQTILYLHRVHGVDLKTFGYRLTEYRMAAAADHCLTAAYRGQCPGVDPQDLKMWRSCIRAKHKKIPLQSLMDNVEYAKSVIDRAKRIVINNVEVAVINESVRELPEAAAQMGIPFQTDAVIKGRARRNIMSAPPEVIATWMADMDKAGCRDVYGDPQRGFAGAYLT